MLNTLAVGATAAYVAAHAQSQSTHIDALVHGYSSATAWSTGLLTGIAAVVFLLINAPRPSASQPANQER